MRGMLSSDHKEISLNRRPSNIGKTNSKYMAKFSKASFSKHARSGGAKRLVYALSAGLVLLGLVNLLLNQPEDVSLLIAHDVSSVDASSSSAASDGVPAAVNTPVDVVASIQSDPFYPKGNLRKTWMFHHTPGSRNGREASVVLDMLIGHAYAFSQGQVYGGSCGAGNDVGREPENKLIQALGLENTVRFACPSDIDAKEKKKEVPVKTYQQYGVRGFTPEYVDLLRGVAKYPPKDDSTYTIVVHIARDKFTPCRVPYQGYDPYLPNKHYQMLIDVYMKPKAKVVIFTQEHSFESLDEFTDKGYEVHIEESGAVVWKAILNADVFIMSRSSFSYVPAMFSKGTVVYTPYWDKPIRGWNTAPQHIMTESTSEFQRIKATCPKQMDKFTKFRKKGG